MQFMTRTHPTHRFAGLGVVLIFAALVSCTRAPDEFALGNFELTDTEQRPLTRANFTERWTFLLFGYTSCPDVCPVTLGELARVYQLLRARPDAPRNVQIVFVSVDPQRDTPDQLRDFARHFGGDVIAATGTIEQLDALTVPIGARHARVPESDGTYRVEHSADVWLIAPDARVRQRFAIPLVADRIANEFVQLATTGP